MKIAFIGGGNMGEAILAALIARNLARPEDVFVADVNNERLAYIKQKYSVFTTGYNPEVAARGEVIILATKPQQMDEAARELKGHLRDNQLVISIIAGKKLTTLCQGLGHKTIVRAMPNTPAQIGQGMTVWTTTEHTPVARRVDAETILGALGHAVYTPDEAVLDMATAISGSGPAYVFLFLEALTQAGQDLGLMPELARFLAFKTVSGATEYAQISNHDLAKLRHNVTSPGGTTAAALKVFEENNFVGLIRQAVAAAYQRAQELGG